MKLRAYVMVSAFFPFPLIFSSVSYRMTRKSRYWKNTLNLTMIWRSWKMRVVFFYFPVADLCLESLRLTLEISFSLPCPLFWRLVKVSIQGLSSCSVTLFILIFCYTAYLGRKFTWVTCRRGVEVWKLEYLCESWENSIFDQSVDFMK